MTVDPIITAPIPAFCRLTGLGRTKIYEMLADGSLDSITIGKRRLIVVELYRRLIERQRLATIQQPAMARRNPKGRADR